MQKMSDTLVDWNQTFAVTLADEASARARTAKVWNWTVSLLALGCGASLAFFITRNVNGSLRVIVKDLSTGAEQTASAAGHVSSASQSLAQGSCAQAASLEETSASSEEINSMAR
jgi:methyl-accepting chemotaxis protein